jgi:hypothetical protein
VLIVSVQNVIVNNCVQLCESKVQFWAQCQFDLLGIGTGSDLDLSAASPRGLISKILAMGLCRESASRDLPVPDR